MNEKLASQSTEINLPQQEKIKSLREFVTNPDGQEKIVNFIENLKSELGSKEGWLSTCQKAEEEIKTAPVNEAALNRINDIFKVFIDQMPPGHDKGHFSRDLLTSIVLYDSIKNQTAFQSDAMAGLLAGAFHDIGTSIIPRYQDNKYGAGHGETGAYLFWQISDGTIGENTRKLVSYAIASHTHYLKPTEVQIPQGYKKDKYWDDTWTDENGKLIGVAIQTTRRADRADTNGITLLTRHIISRMDSIEEGGQDFSGGEWVNLNHDALVQTLQPIVRDPIGNPPTALEHVFRFAKSNDGKNPYSEKDYLFPGFQEVLTIKLNQMKYVLDAMESSESVDGNQQSMHDLFYKISKSDSTRFEKAWVNFQSIWSGLNSESKSRWAKGLIQVKQSYDQLLDFYDSKIKNSEFSDFANKVVTSLKI